MKQNTPKQTLQVLFLLALVLIAGCDGGKTSEAEPLLECVLDAYISYYGVNDSQLIDISDMAGWTDSSAVIVVRSYAKERNVFTGTFLQAKYKGIAIHLLQGRLGSSGASINNETEKVISNNLDWQIVRAEKRIKDEYNIPPPEEFDEIQIIYNPKRKCIERELMVEEKMKAQIIKQCKYCSS